MSDIEKNEIELKQEMGYNPDGLIKDIVDEVNKLVPTSGKAAAHYISGKGLKPLAEISEIKARAYEKIARVANDNQKLAMGHKQQMFRLVTERRKQEVDDEVTKAKALKIRTESFSEIVKAVEELLDMGIKIDAKEVIKKLMDATE